MEKTKNFNYSRYFSFKRMARVISFIALIIIFILVYISNVNNNDGKKFNIMNMRPVVIVSGSMLPEIQINSLSIMEYCNLSDLSIGDVAVYRHPTKNILITHRVIEKHMDADTPYVITKGDNNPIQDGIDITADLVVGRLVETYNWTKVILDKVIMDGGRINTVALLLVVIALTILVSVITYIGNFLVISISSFWLVRFDNERLENCVRAFDSGIKEQNTIKKEMPDLKYKKGDSARDIIGKMILLSHIKTMDTYTKDLRLADKMASKVGGWDKNSK